MNFLNVIDDAFCFCLSHLCQFKHEIEIERQLLHLKHSQAASIVSVLRIDAFLIVRTTRFQLHREFVFCILPFVIEVFHFRIVSSN